MKNMHVRTSNVKRVCNLLHFGRILYNPKYNNNIHILLSTLIPLLFNFPFLSLLLSLITPQKRVYRVHS